jgi:hypothetical protein
MAFARKDTNDKGNQWKKDKAEKAQTFAAAATASKQDDSSSDEDEDDTDKKTFIKSFMASWKSSKKDKNSQKNRRTRSDKDTSDSEQNYSMSSIIVALKPKREKIGIPTTESIGETTVNGRKTPLHILTDTGSSSSIILKKFINKSLLVKKSRTNTEWTNLGGKLYRKKQGKVKFKLPGFCFNKTIELKVHVDETNAHANASYDMII